MKAWRREGDDRGLPIIVTDEESAGRVICVVGRSFHPTELRESRARLIAAAPELLAALKKITDEYASAMRDAGVTRYPESLAIVRDARAAITKATQGE